jgi:hypothetical protein
VLKAVDWESSTELRTVIETKWQEVKDGERNREPPIFWDFIDDERNQIIHKYASSAGQSIVVPVDDPEKSVTPYHMNKGPFAGKDPRDVVEEAIEWWDNYLSEIEAAAS